MKLWIILSVLMALSTTAWVIGEVGLRRKWNSWLAYWLVRSFSMMALGLMFWVTTATVAGWMWPDSYGPFGYLGVDFRDFPFERDQ